jgi:hypothetical protein
MIEKPLSHQVKIVKISEILPCPNADKLSIINTLGFQTVVPKDQFKVGDYGYFVPPDSVLSVRPEYEFLWKDKVVPGEIVPVKYRRIRAVRLRGNWSEGLLMPLKAGTIIPLDNWYDIEGTDISDLLGIEHWNPPEPEDMEGQNERGPKRHLPKTLRGWVLYLWWNLIGRLGFSTPLQGSNEKGPKDGKVYYDIDNAKHFPDVFQEGEDVVITEKIHGCQGKYVFQDGKMYAGSRNYWKSKNSTCVRRKTLAQNIWIEDWCKRNEGYTLYGEIVPVQGQNFMYGCKQGELKFLVFDILKPDHTWVSKKDLFDLVGMYVSLDILAHWVPDLYHGPYYKEDIKNLVEGKSILDKNTIREGIVITSYEEQHVRGLGRKILKLISNDYLSKN